MSEAKSEGTSEATSEVQTFQGGCHCGKVRFEITTNLKSATACNCSICSRKGWLLTFVGTDQFKLLSGSEALTDYQFAKKKIHHTFCSVCGIASFGTGSKPDGTKMYSVNVRCLDGVDTQTLPIHHYDGKSV